MESREARLQIPRCVDVKLDVRLADFPLDTDVVPKLMKVCSFGPIWDKYLIQGKQVNCLLPDNTSAEKHNIYTTEVNIEFGTSR